MEPRFAQVLDQVCSQAAAAAAAGGSEGAAAARAEAAQPKQQRELPPVSASREELQAMPASHSKCCRPLHNAMPGTRRPLRACFCSLWPAIHHLTHAPACSQLPLQVRQLKQLLEERGISFADLNEKGEMVDRILERCSRVTYYR